MTSARVKAPASTASTSSLLWLACSKKCRNLIPPDTAESGENREDEQKPVSRNECAAPFAIYVRCRTSGTERARASVRPRSRRQRVAWPSARRRECVLPRGESVDLDVSGGLAAEDRRLGRLIDRCEAGEFAGIIVPYEDRFARDVVGRSRCRPRCGRRHQRGSNGASPDACLTQFAQSGTLDTFRISHAVSWREEAMRNVDRLRRHT